MLGEDEKDDLELADAGTNDAEGDVDEGGENLAVRQTSGMRLEVARSGKLSRSGEEDSRADDSVS